MEKFLFYLQLATTVALFGHIVWMRNEKKKDWLEALSVILAIAYFSFTHLNVLAVGHLGLIILLCYHYLAEKSASVKFEQLLRAIIILAGLVFTVANFSETLDVVEYLGIVLLVFSTQAFASKWKPLGWALLFLYHICLAYIAYHIPNQSFFAPMQIASTMVAMSALRLRR